MHRCVKVQSFFIVKDRKFHTSSLDTYSSLIDAYSDRRELRSGTKLHSHLITTGLVRRTHIASKLIAFYTACGKPDDARQLFDEIPNTNIRRWIVLVGAHSRHGSYRHALGAFLDMQREGIRQNVFVVPSALKACANLDQRRAGENLHAMIVKHSFDSDAFVVSALIDMYSKTGQVEKARRVFDETDEKDSVAMNALVSGYTQRGSPEEALSLVEEMEASGRLKPNIVTWNSLVAGFSQKGDVKTASRLLRSMHGKGIEPDVVSWTSVISGSVQNFRYEEAFSAFKHMLACGLRPNPAAISSLLSACSAVANSRHGKEIHGYAILIGIEEDVFVRSALVDMYGKSGRINEAAALFSDMSERNTATWNSMIFGYANNGLCDKALRVFNQMVEKDREKLDHLSFTAVLTACSHGRLIGLGKSLFSTMEKNYGIVPRLEHYACVVDLLGRAGKLQEAHCVIKAMPIKPDLFVWGALLGACKNHGDVDLAEVAAKHLAELEPESAGNKKLLSSLYADSGNWGNVARLKRSANRKKLRRFPGYSWIETA